MKLKYPKNSRAELSTIADLVWTAEEYNGELYFRDHSGQIWGLKRIEPLELVTEKLPITKGDKS